MTRSSELIRDVKNIFIDLSDLNVREFQNNLSKIDTSHRDAARKILSACKVLGKALKEFEGAYDPSDKTNYYTIIGIVAKVCPKIKYESTNHGSTMSWEGLTLAQLRSLYKEGILENTVFDNQGEGYKVPIKDYIQKLSKLKVPFSVGVSLFDEHEEPLRVAYILVKKNDLEKAISQTGLDKSFFEVQ